MALLSPVTQKFVLHWGEMGARWGINRSVAQIHALLYVSPEPLNAEEISTTLSLARSNVSYGLRELQNWGVIRAVPVLGDRREHYQSLEDVWQMFRLVLEGRKHREVDPTLAVLRGCVEQLEGQTRATERHALERLRDMLEFFESANAVFEEVRKLSHESLRKIARSGVRLQRLLAALD
jgi:DNA-binding transcriptional regulator GbsR (MarR family)